MASGWRIHSDLRQIVQRSLQSPGSVEVVPLGRHTVSVFHQPSISVTIEGTVAATLTFQLDLVVDVETLTATVTGGALSRVRAGRCTATGTVVP